MPTTFQDFVQTFGICRLDLVRTFQVQPGLLPNKVTQASLEDASIISNSLKKCILKNSQHFAGRHVIAAFACIYRKNVSCLGHCVSLWANPLDALAKIKG